MSTTLETFLEWQRTGPSQLPKVAERKEKQATELEKLQREKVQLEQKLQHAVKATEALRYQLSLVELRIRDNPNWVPPAERWNWRNPIIVLKPVKVRKQRIVPDFDLVD